MGRKYYNAEKSKAAGQKTIADMTELGRAVLDRLNPPHAQDYWGDRRPTRTAPIERTHSGKHYRLDPRLVSVLRIEPADVVGATETVPPTVLATVDEVVSRIDGYARWSILPVVINQTVRDLMLATHRQNA